MIKIEVKNGKPQFSAKVEVNDKKYTFIVPEGDWRVHVLRYGEEWLVIEQGHNAVLALMMEVEELREELDKLRE